MKKTMYVCMSPFCPPPPLTTYVCTRGDVLSERSLCYYEVSLEAP